MHITHLFDAISAALHIPPVHSVLPFSRRGVPTIQAQFTLYEDLSLSPILYDEAVQKKKFNWKSLLSLKEDDRRQKYSETKEYEHQTMHSNPNRNKQSSTVIPNPSFPDAVLLLRANILSLCLRLGVPRNDLWPPQALLLNLHELQLFMQLELKAAAYNPVGSSAISLPLVYSSEEAYTMGLALDEGVLQGLAYRYSSRRHQEAQTERERERERAREERLEKECERKKEEEKQSEYIGSRGGVSNRDGDKDRDREKGRDRAEVQNRRGAGEDEDWVTEM